MLDERFKAGGPARTIVIVKSCQKFQDRQEACRATWAGELSRRGVPIWFIEGGHPTTRVKECWFLYNGGDGYDDNSIKVRDCLKFFLEHDPFDRVFICDDNTFVQWQRWLDYVPAAEFAGLKTKAIPWVHGGAGWYMTRDACEKYAAGITRRCSWDDRLVSQILDPLGVPFENRPDLFAQWDERVGADNQLITCHNVGSLEMAELFTKTFDLM